jgi:hypothetical protein
MQKGIVGRETEHWSMEPFSAPLGGKTGFELGSKPIKNSVCHEILQGIDIMRNRLFGHTTNLEIAFSGQILVIFRISAGRSPFGWIPLVISGALAPPLTSGSRQNHASQCRWTSTRRTNTNLRRFIQPSFRNIQRIRRCICVS